jgi:hypothetical protein
MTAEQDRWYVIASPEHNVYMRWGGGREFGAYTDARCVYDAERYETRDMARLAMRRVRVARYVKARKALGMRVCRVDRVATVT